MKNKIKQLEEELHEQCVLNGKGSEREANLLGKVERLERENAALREALKNAIMLLRRWNKNDVTDDVVIETRKAIHAALKEAQT